MKQRLIGLTMGLTVSAFAPAFAGDATWYADYDEAVKVAKEQEKDLLVDFTGSDWCGWCIRLNKEVFDHEVWQKGVADDYILVALDFPNDPEIKAKVPNPERNKELQKELGVGGFPTILLMNVEGEVFARTGYQAGGPEKYLAHMTEIAGEGRMALAKSKSVIAAFDGAQADEDKWSAYEGVMGLLDELTAGSPFIEGLLPAALWGFETDADNAKGARFRSALALAKIGAAEDEHMAYIEGADPKNEKGALEYLVEARFGAVKDDATARLALEFLHKVNGFGFQNKELGFNLNMQAVMWCQGPLADEELALIHANAAKAIGTDDEAAMKELDKIIGKLIG